MTIATSKATLFLAAAVMAANFSTPVEAANKNKRDSLTAEQKKDLRQRGME